jgi:hypothetical protein
MSRRNTPPFSSAVDQEKDEQEYARRIIKP